MLKGIARPSGHTRKQFLVAKSTRFRGVRNGDGGGRDLERYQADPPAATTGGDRDMRERAGRCSPKVYPLPSCPNRLRNRSR